MNLNVIEPNHRDVDNSLYEKRCNVWLCDDDGDDDDDDIRRMNCTPNQNHIFREHHYAVHINSRSSNAHIDF